jgi:O-antigen/teichoic acid export membrane protein
MDFKPQTIYTIAALVAAAGLAQAIISYRAMVAKDKNGNFVTLSKNMTIGLMVAMAVAFCFFIWVIIKGRGGFKGLKLM